MASPGTQRPLSWLPVVAQLGMVAEPVAGLLKEWPPASDVTFSEIDPELSDTAAFCERYGVSPDESANCVVVAGRRDGETRRAACVVLATQRVDVNGIVRRLLDVRKASFLPMSDAVALTGMEHGGITPLGLPGDWRIFLAPEVARSRFVVIGSGVRRSKLRLPGSALTRVPGAEVIEGLSARIDAADRS